jgi:hypothetical protein
MKAMIVQDESSPFVQDGLLCLPESVVALLVRGGLSEPVAESARRGLMMKDNATLVAITESLHDLVRRVQHGSDLSAR